MLSFMDQAGAAHTVDVTPWFASTPAASLGIYWGFTRNSPATAADVLAGQTRQANSADYNLLPYTWTRSTPTSAYLFMWLPNSVGSVQGFIIAPFVENWRSSALTVNNIQGTLYMSENHTTALTRTYKLGIK